MLPHHQRNPEDQRIVPRFSGSKENLWLNAGEGNIDSVDLTPSFRIDIKTRYGMQEAPSFAATMPARDKGKASSNKGRPPLAPLVVRDHHDADELEVTRRTMGATIAEQEATIEALNAKLAHQEKTVALMRNLIISFCAFCQHK